MRALATSLVRFFNRKPWKTQLGLLMCLAVSGFLNVQIARGQSPEVSIWTRSKGQDWPRMLGVHYDSKSNETGILTQWPKEGLRVLWSQKTGTGYGNGVAALGRWFQFDRFGNSERLTCYEAQTGKFLWKWEPRVEYHDA